MMMIKEGGPPVAKKGIDKLDTVAERHKWCWYIMVETLLVLVLVGL